MQHAARSQHICLRACKRSLFGRGRGRLLRLVLVAEGRPVVSAVCGVWPHMPVSSLLMELMWEHSQWGLRMG